MPDHNCKGCISYHYRYHRCGFIESRYSCPCSICLVKPMCNKICDDLKTHIIKHSNGSSERYNTLINRHIKSKELEND